MAVATLTAGRVLDGFTVGEMLHKGGMAMLWRVSKPGITMPMLMKVPVLFEGEDPAAIVGFEMEQMILPRLSGPHVPKFIAAGDFSVQPYIVMEQIDAPTLLPLLTELPLPYERVADIGHRIAVALNDLHHQNVIHLDVKPSNVIIRPTGEAALVDFGLSHHAQLPDLMDEEFRLPYGTAPYMAPEQINGVRTDPRSDLFALGALMYFFATGVRPFGDPQRLKGLKRRCWRDPVPPRKLKRDFPPWLQEVILKCLEVNPAWRYSNARQLAFDLANPSQVKLTARAERIRQDPWLTAIKRRFNPDMQQVPRKQELARQLDLAPIIAVAIDLDAGETLSEALRTTVRRVLDTVPGGRLACINVLKESRLMIDSTLDDEGHSKHIRRLVQLKGWAQPLRLDDGQLSYHVLSAVSPAAAILEYARSNHVDHIVLGARANSTMRTLLGSVSAEVAGQAPCTVTVVRPPRAGADAGAEDAEAARQSDTAG
jgi:serine/threonine protein kinase